MNKIFHYGIILFIIVGLIFNKQEAMLKALLQTPFDVFELCKTLILSICLWNGLLKIIQASNMVNHLNFLFKPLLRWIYGRCIQDEQIYQALSSNLIANLLGLGTLATMSGLQAISKLKEKNLNKIIKESYSTYLKSEKKKKDQKDILYLDYSCKKIYKQYVVVELDYKRINEDETKAKATKSIMTYDCKTNQLLTLKDCLHGKYGDLLNTLGVSEYDKESTSIKVDQDSFTYFTDQKLKNKITINYKENKDYIKLANKNIPSNAPLDVKAPKLMKVDPKKKMVAITLDDGPHKTLTERAMNAFEKYNGRGTFFELGQNMNLYPDIVKSVYERGHEVASHTYQHAQLTKLDATALDEEIKKTQEACFKACGTEPTLIRPPYGAKNDTVKSAFYSYGLSMILWDGDTEDWRYSKVTNGAQIVCDNIIRDAKSKTGDGNIVLIHDIHENSVAGLEMALDQLSKEGYQFVTVSDLLKYKGHSEYK